MILKIEDMPNQMVFKHTSELEKERILITLIKQYFKRY